MKKKRQSKDKNKQLGNINCQQAALFPQQDKLQKFTELVNEHTGETVSYFNSF